MPRPTPAQFCTGTLIVVLTTVALLAVSGATAVPAVTALVALAVALGVLATALLMAADRRRRSATREAPDRRRSEPLPAAQPTAPEYARQR
ncbi:hypothetical protein ACFC1R_07145 [Kitasatospora sp. NPDC056138]|uniref:hypothetical protein n=1 Tax=Kitasatospora sp. NPDC056138 TaxID=3345724 RepID=UPI0035D87A51